MGNTTELKKYAELITSYVEKRGWLDGFSDVEILLRQDCMIFQEVAEAVSYARWVGDDIPFELVEYFEASADMQTIGKAAFKGVIDEWGLVELPYPAYDKEDAMGYATETADTLIPLMIKAVFIKKVYGLDIFEIAIDKASADVKRGRA